MELPGVFCITPPAPKRWSGFEPLLPSPREPTIYGPLKERRIKSELEFFRALPLSYPGAKAGGRTRTGDLVVYSDNPILRPVEKHDGQGMSWKTSLARCRGARTRSFLSEFNR